MAPRSSYTGKVKAKALNLSNPKGAAVMVMLKNFEKQSKS